MLEAIWFRSCIWTQFLHNHSSRLSRALRYPVTFLTSLLRTRWRGKSEVARRALSYPSHKGTLKPVSQCLTSKTLKGNLSIQLGQWDLKIVSPSPLSVLCTDAISQLKKLTDWLDSPSLPSHYVESSCEKIEIHAGQWASCLIARKVYFIWKRGCRWHEKSFFLPSRSVIFQIKVLDIYP